VIVTVTPGAMIGHFLRLESAALPASISLNEAVTVATGKGINVSRTVKAFAAPTVALGCAAGWTGKRLEQLMQEEGIPFEAVEAQGENRTGIYIMDPKGTLLHEVVDERFSAGPRTEDDLLALIRRRLAGARYVACSGRIPPGFSQGFFKKLVDLCRDANVPCLIDARGPALRWALGSRPFMIKPNEQELADFAGETPPSDLEALPDYCRARFDIGGAGPENVLLSLGPRGAILITSREAWHVCVDEQVTGNPIGCGDTLVGGTLAALLSGSELVEAVRRGVAAATSNLATDSPGAVPLDLYRSYLERTRVRIL